ncbi:hypothetical protein ACQY0O_001441 [Thecaphora frezii]
MADTSALDTSALHTSALPSPTLCTPASTPGDERKPPLACDPSEEKPSAPPCVPPAPDGGVSAWTFVLAGWTLELMVWGASYSLGTFQDYHEHNPSSPFYGTGITALSSIGTLVVAAQHVVPFLTYGLVGSFGHRLPLIAALSVGVSALCLVVASFAGSVGMLVAFQGLFYGFIGGFLFIPVVLWLPQWFDKRRGLATGVILSGTGVGGIVFPLVFNALLASVGFRWTLRVWALLHLVLAGLAVAFLRPPIQAKPRQAPVTLRELLPPLPAYVLDRRFALYTSAIAFQAMGWYTISLYISSYTTSHGYSASTSTLVLVVFNASSTLTTFLTGGLVDRFSYAIVMGVSMLLCALASLLVLGFADSLGLILVFAIVFGVAGGGFSCQFTPMSNAFSRRSGVPFGLVYFTMMLFRAVAVVAGPLVASALYPHDASANGVAQTHAHATYGAGGFTPMVVFVGASMLVTALAASLIYWQECVDRRKAQDASA